VGWALLHSLWQGALVAIAAGVALAVARDDPRWRHHVAAAGLGLMLVAVMATAVHEGRRAAERARQLSAAGESIRALDPDAFQARVMAGSRPAGAAGRPAARRAPSRVDELERLVDGALPALVAAWLCGVLLLSIRLAAAWRATRRVRTAGVLPLPPPWEARVARIARAMRLSTPVRVLQSLAVDVPMVIGALKPVVLIPASLLTGMPVAQLELLVAHELAHVRRCDYLLNLLQSVAEVVLFHHPVTWWLSREMREAREQCCDDMAIQALGSPWAYVEALVALEVSRTPRLLATAASGGSLVKRAERLLRPGCPAGGRPRLGVPAAGVAFMAASIALSVFSGRITEASAGAPGALSTAPAALAASPPGASPPSRWADDPSGARPAQPRGDGRGARLALPGGAAADGPVWLSFATREGACGTPSLLVLRARDRNVAVQGTRMDVGYSDRPVHNWNAVSPCADGPLRVRLDLADGRLVALSASVRDGSAPAAAEGDAGTADPGQAAEYLVSLAREAPAEISARAIAAAAMADGPAPVSALLSLAQDPGASARSRVFALRWLGHLADSSAVPAFERLARGSAASADVRLAAAEALGALAAGTGSAALLRLASDAPDPRIRDAARAEWTRLQTRLAAFSP
jgi:beta-lactamase regulating signal transducer with metallopeptidase domain